MSTLFTTVNFSLNNFFFFLCNKTQSVKFCILGKKINITTLQSRQYRFFLLIYLFEILRKSMISGHRYAFKSIFFRKRLIQMPVPCRRLILCWVPYLYFIKHVEQMTISKMLEALILSFYLVLVPMEEVILIFSESI